MLRLRACLEEIARQGPDYVINECGYEWEARELLTWLAVTFPYELECLVHFLRPDRYGDGAIYEEGNSGELIYAVPLYWVQRRRVAVGSPIWSGLAPGFQQGGAAACSPPSVPGGVELRKAAISLLPPHLESAAGSRLE
jgi:hypothetical protein